MEKRLRKYLINGNFGTVVPKVSKTMSLIRGKKNRTTELKLRMLLISKGIKGWKLHAIDLKGNPDFYFKKQKLAIFVDGCFWHGCRKCGHIPKTRSDFWKAKINRNRKRDRECVRILKDLGIKSIRIWEHELKNQKDREKVISKIIK